MTLTHEHLFVVDAEYAWNYYPAERVEQIISAAAAQLDAAYEAGVRTVVDCTVLGIGRIVPWIRELAARTRVNLVLATGVYATGELPRMFALRGPGTLLGGPEPMTEMFVRDLIDGIGDTGIRAGAIKCATDEEGLTAGVERILRASARASLATGAPILTHTHAASRQGLAQLAVFADEGVDPARVVIGHSGDTSDETYLEQILDQGYHLGFDRFSYRAPMAFEDRVALVARLCGRGHAARIVLSEDAACFHAWLDEEARERISPGADLTTVPRRVVPALLELGVSQADVDMMLRVNPARLLAAHQD